MKKLIIGIFVLFAIGIYVVPIYAQTSKVDVCHTTGNGTYRLINISERALKAHLGHGDAFPGNEVEDGILNENCNIEARDDEMNPLMDYGVITSDLLNFSDGGFAGWSVPGGTVVLGGGFALSGGPAGVSTPGIPSYVWPHYAFGANEYGWVVRDTADGESSPESLIYVIHANIPEGYEIFSSSTMTFSDSGFAGWSCPIGKVVLGGGFKATAPVAVSAPGTPDSVWPHYTFGANEYGWVVQDAPDGVANTITIYTICADEPKDYSVESYPDVVFSDKGFGGWSCPIGTVITGGGFKATAPVAVSAPGTPDSVWPHYTFGANEYGWVVQDAPDGVGSTTTIYSICAGI